MKTVLLPLLAAGALALGARAGPLLAAQVGVQVGVQVAVNQDATGTNPGAVPRRIVIGQEVVHDERIDTNAAGQTQLLFLDESSMSIGPNADLVVDSFVYDPQTGAGQLAMSATRGVFRYIGGKLSKLEGAVTIGTPDAALGIRGGIMLMELTPQGGLAAIFGYGRALTVTGREGTTETITRPGWEVTVARPGAAPSPPFPAPPGTIARLLAQLDGLPGRHGGAPTIPRDADVAGSALDTDLSQVPPVPSGGSSLSPLPSIPLPPPVLPGPRSGRGAPSGPPAAR